MANRYWVGGTGTWDTTSTANWSATSGGAAGASAPTAADIALFDANSGGGTVTIAENITLLVFNPAAFTSGTIDFNNKVVNVVGNAQIVYNGGTAPTMTGNPQVNLTYAGGTGTRTINGGIAVLEANAVSFTVTAGSDIVSMGGNGARLRNLTFDVGFTGSFTRASSGGLYGSLTMHSGMSFTATANTLSFVPTTTQTITTGGLVVDCAVVKDSTGALQLQDNLTMGSTRTFTLTAGTLNLNNQTLSTGLFNSSTATVRSIAFGTGNITLTGNSATVWTTSSATNLTTSGSRLVQAVYSGSTGTRTIAFGATTEADGLNLNVTAGTDAIALGSPTGVIKNVNFTGFSGTLNGGARVIYGNLTISTGMTLASSGGAITFAATSGTQLITTNGKTFDFPLIFNGIGGTFAFQDALTQGATRTFTITNGTVQLKDGVTSTVGSFVASSSNAKFLQSTTPGSQATLSQASGTVSVTDLTIRDINAVGGASWNAYTDFENTDAGNNDGWNFSLSPPYASYEPPIIIRSFTQPRRF